MKLEFGSTTHFIGFFPLFHKFRQNHSLYSLNLDLLCFPFLGFELGVLLQNCKELSFKKLISENLGLGLSDLFCSFLNN